MIKHILMLSAVLVFCAHPVRGQTPPSKEECIKALASKDSDVAARRKAARGLGEFAYEADEVIPSLESALIWDKEQDVRLDAVASLIQIAKTCRKVAEDPKTPTKLKDKINGSIGKIAAVLARPVRSRGETQEVRIEAARALGDIATPKAVEALEEAKSLEGKGAVRDAIEEALKLAGSPADVVPEEPAGSNEQGGKKCSVCRESHAGKPVKGHQIYCPLQGCYGHWDADRPHCSKCKRNRHHSKGQHE